MKLTTKNLKKLIKEELSKIEEAPVPEYRDEAGLGFYHDETHQEQIGATAKRKVYLILGYDDYPVLVYANKEDALEALAVFNQGRKNHPVESTMVELPFIESSKGI